MCCNGLMFHQGPAVAVGGWVGGGGGARAVGQSLPEARGVCNSVLDTNPRGVGGGGGGGSGRGGGAVEIFSPFWGHF